MAFFIIYLPTTNLQSPFWCQKLSSLQRGIFIYPSSILCFWMFPSTTLPHLTPPQMSNQGRILEAYLIPFLVFPINCNCNSSARLVSSTCKYVYWIYLFSVSTIVTTLHQDFFQPHPKTKIIFLLSLLCSIIVYSLYGNLNFLFFFFPLHPCLFPFLINYCLFLGFWWS